MTSIKTSYSTSGSAVGSYFYEYEYEYKIPSSLRSSMSFTGSNSANFSVMKDSEGNVQRVLGYGINLI